MCNDFIPGADHWRLHSKGQLLLMFLIGLVGQYGSASITLHFSQPGPRTLRVFRVSQLGGKSETLLTGIPKKAAKQDEAHEPECSHVC